MQRMGKRYKMISKTFLDQMPLGKLSLGKMLLGKMCLGKMSK